MDVRMTNVATGQAQAGLSIPGQSPVGDGMALVAGTKTGFGTDRLERQTAGAIDSALVAYGGAHSERDVEALVRAVAAEARGEGPAVWRGVAGTIVNYARRYGKDITALTRSSYLSSNYDHNRVFFEMPLGNIPNYHGIRQAVLEALNGAGGVGRSTHFFDTSISAPYFVRPETCIPRGNMRFCEGR